MLSPHDDGIGLDEFDDWLIDGGHTIQRIPDYAEWLQRFEIAVRALRISSARRRCCRCCTTSKRQM